MAEPRTQILNPSYHLGLISGFPSTGNAGSATVREFVLLSLALFLPTSYEVWGKVMFSQVFVCPHVSVWSVRVGVWSREELSGQRGWVSSQRPGGCLVGGVGEVWSEWDGCLVRGMSGQRGCLIRGLCLRGEKVSAAVDTHLTGMHSCGFYRFLLFMVMFVPPNCESFIYCHLLENTGARE